MATHLAEQEKLKCPLCKRILTNKEYQQVQEELQRTQDLLADYEEEIYEKDLRIQMLEDTIRRRISTVGYQNASTQGFRQGWLQ
jgi:hypothetical protein